MEIFDPATNSWTAGASMPTARHSMAAAAIDGRLYVVGGNDGTGNVDTVEVYDPVTDTWSTDTSLPTPRQQLVAEVINGELYAVTGVAAGALTPVLEVLTATDPVEDFIAQLEADLAAALAEIISLQGEIDSLNATITGLNNRISKLQSDLDAANLTVAKLNAQIDQLQAKLTAANATIAERDATIAALQAQVNSVNGSTASLDVAFQRIFSDPSFKIPGATTEEKIANLISAIQRLNRGRQQGLYVNLGGTNGSTTASASGKKK